MRKFLYNWRYYSFGKDRYAECMGKLFIGNLNNLRHANLLVAVIAFFFSFFPLFYDRDFIVMSGCLASAVIAVGFGVYLNYKMQGKNVGNTFIYIFTVLFFVNIMVLSIYLGVWVFSDRIAALFLISLLCALLMFVNPPFFNFCLTFAAMAVFIICAFIFKSREIFLFDVVHTFIAGVMNLFLCWQITKLRIGLELSANMLEEERNKYLDQSVIDELTQLNNRRDFFKTFQRYLSSYRANDCLLCVAMLDIDFFKNYNDHYGHPQGDECLRSVGAAFNKLKDAMGVYAARVGGEEFAILWFEKDASHVDDVVDCMFNLIKEMKIPHEKSKVSEYVTMSMGVYVENTSMLHDVKTLYDLADKELYSAKEGGRNRAFVNGRDIKRYKILPRP